MAQAEKSETSMMKESLLAAYERNLGLLKKEIEAYTNEESIWQVREGILNSGGNLCLHMVGNLNHFVGTNLAKTGYVRDRDGEFSDTGLSRAELIARIEAVTSVVGTTIGNLAAEDLADDYPELLFDNQMDTGTVLAYMSGHLAYHLGQLNYHRRLLDKLD